MTINERTSLLPKEYQKEYSITIPQDDVNNNISNSIDNGVLDVYDSYALTKDELNKYIDDPWWIRMRYGCFATCWVVCLIALAISMYIAADALRNDLCGATTNSSTTLLPPASPSSTANPLAIVDPSTPTTIVFALLQQQT